MALAILMGALAGFAGFLPLGFALKLTQRSSQLGMGATAVQSLGGVTVSLIVLALAMFAASRIAHEFVGVFGLVELVSFVVISVVYFMWRNKVLRRSAKDTNSEGEEQ